MYNSRVIVNPFSLVSVADKSTVSVLVDKAFSELEPSAQVAIHAGSADKTAVVCVSQVLEFLKGEGIQFVIHDFSAAPQSAPAATEQKKPNTQAKANKSASLQTVEKETKIGLEVKKEEDFSTWYQQASVLMCYNHNHVF